MRKRWIFIVLGASGLAAAAGAMFWWQVDDARSARSSAKGAAKNAAPSFERQVQAIRGEKPVSIEELLADDSPEAWYKVRELYPRADDDTKRQVLRKATSRKNLKQALTQVLQTAGEDPRPLAEDPLVLEVAEMLKGRWKSPEDLELGRQMMLLQETDKKSWVVGKALVTFAEEIGPQSPLLAQKNRLKAKLVDLHARVKSEIVDSLHSLGGRDAALILAKGPEAVSDGELEGIATQQRAVQEVVGEDR